MEQDVIIEMKKINKGYLLGTEKVPVLKNVDFRVRKGEYVAILGPSGSGKTGAISLPNFPEVKSKECPLQGPLWENRRCF